MIKSLKLQNFQSHPNSELNFCPGVNVIIGQSDSGKTALLRALRWVIWNRPSGESFRSSWGGDTRACVETTDDQEVIRIRTNTDNAYIVDNGEGIVLEMKAFGMDVPDGVTEILKMNDLNFQQQLDSPFLLNENPGTVAAHFNRIAHLDKIDSSVSLLKRWSTALTQQIKDGKNQAQQITADLQKYDTLDAQEHLLEQAEALDAQMSEHRNNQQLLRNIQAEWQRVEKRITHYEKTTVLAPVVTQALSVIEERKKIQAECNQLTTVRENWKRTLSKIEEYSRLIRLREPIEDAQIKQSQIKKAQRDLNHIREYSRKLSDVNRRMETTFQYLQTNQQAFREQLGEVCPLCGQGVEWDEKTIKF